jgi:hypothetical protein
MDYTNKEIIFYKVADYLNYNNIFYKKMEEFHEDEIIKDSFQHKINILDTIIYDINMVV